MNDNKLYLYPGCDKSKQGNYLEYDLMTYDCHYDSYEEFHPIAIEIAEQLLIDCVPLSVHTYGRKKASKKNLFGRKKPAEFYANETVDKLLEYISYAKRNWSYCNIEYTEQDSLYKSDHKIFFVKAPKIDTLFIEKNYSDTTGVVLSGYLPQYCANTDNIEAIANDFLKNNEIKRNNYAISIYFDNSHTKIDISLNPAYYPVKQLIERITNVAKKYNKTLEVEI